MLSVFLPVKCFLISLDWAIYCEVLLYTNGSAKLCSNFKAPFSKWENHLANGEHKEITK